MSAVDRLLQIEALVSAQAVRIVVIELDEELLGLICISKTAPICELQNNGTARPSTATVIIGSQRRMN